MSISKRTTALGLIGTMALALQIVLACSSSGPATPPDTGISTSATVPAGGWSALLQKTPFPYTTPLPPADPSSLDGTYVELDPIQETRAPCRRCPPYPPDGGIWKLGLDRGVYRIYHPRTGWHSLGSYAVSGEQITFFNDPHCYEAVGVYVWRLDQGQLDFTLVDDPCGKHLRAGRLTKLGWTSCQRPATTSTISAISTLSTTSTESTQAAGGAGSDGWTAPPGCRDD